MADYIGLSKKIVINVASSNVDSLYGPYDSVAAAISAIPSSLRQVGKTVGINTGGTVIEYWFNGGILDSNLVQKVTGSSGSSNTISTANVTSETTTYFNNNYPNAKVGDVIINPNTGGYYQKYSSTGWIKLAGTILTDTAPTVATVTSAEVISYK